MKNRWKRLNIIIGFSILLLIIGLFRNISYAGVQELIEKWEVNRSKGNFDYKTAEELRKFGKAVVPYLLKRIEEITKDADSKHTYLQSDYTGFLNEIARETKGKELIPILIEALESESAYVRMAAIEALETICDPDGTTPLIEILDDKNLQVKRCAITALCRIGRFSGDKRVIPALIRPLGDEDSFWVTLVGLEYLTDHYSKIKDKSLFYELVPPLLALLDHKDSDVRRRVTKVLGQIGESGVIPHLVPLLGDEEAGVRNMATTALIEIANKDSSTKQEVKQALIPQLKHKDIWTQLYSAYTLGKIGDRGGIWTLTRNLFHPRHVIRLHSAYLLADLGYRRGASILILAFWWPVEDSNITKSVIEDSIVKLYRLDSFVQIMRFVIPIAVGIFLIGIGFELSLQRESLKIKPWLRVCALSIPFLLILFLLIMKHGITPVLQWLCLMLFVLPFIVHYYPFCPFLRWSFLYLSIFENEKKGP